MEFLVEFATASRELHLTRYRISGPEEDPGYIDIYNCDGTIKIWHDDTGFVDLAGHSKLKPSESCLQIN